MDNNYKIQLLEDEKESSPLICLELGMLYQEVRMYDKSESAFKKACTLLPGNLYPRFLLLKLYIEKGDRTKLIVLANDLLSSNNPKITTDIKLELYKILFWNRPEETKKNQIYPQRTEVVNAQYDSAIQN